MTKESIIERLLDQGHIVIACADRILNKKAGYIQDIERIFHRDSNINTKESIRILTEPSLLVEPSLLQHRSLLVEPTGEDDESMGETCRNGKLWKDCTCC